MRIKTAVLENCLPPVKDSGCDQEIGSWRKTPLLLKWLESL